MARRQSLAAMLVTGLVAAFVGMAAYAVDASAPASPAPLVTTTDLGHDNPDSPEAGVGLHNSEAVVGNRAEAAGEVSSKIRRLSSRDGRTLDWFAVFGIAGAGLAAFSASLARRKPRRAAIASRGLAPSRAPPLLLPS